MKWQEIVKKYEERNDLIVTDVDYVARTITLAARKVAAQQAEDFYGVVEKHWTMNSKFRSEEHGKEKNEQSNND